MPHLNSELRKAAWAGQFYPAQPARLRNMILDFFNQAPRFPLSEPIFGLIVPHAGYQYSGPTAAVAYNMIGDRSYQSVIILAPSHSVMFSGVSVFDGNAYQTPLGDVPVNKELSEKIASFAPNIRLSQSGHTAAFGERSEHSLEVQLPFLQVALGNTFRLVAIVFHDYSLQNCTTLGNAISRSLDDEKTLLVASSDLYHGYSVDECRASDDRTIRAIESMDIDELCRGVNEGEYQACGSGPISALLFAAKERGVNKVHIVARTNSAEVTGMTGGWTVGYAAALVTAG
jgi:AmmeMemoRadiSam system protein B